MGLQLGRLRLLRQACKSPRLSTDDTSMVYDNLRRLPSFNSWDPSSSRGVAEYSNPSEIQSIESFSHFLLLPESLGVAAVDQEVLRPILVGCVDSEELSDWHLQIEGVTAVLKKPRKLSTLKVRERLVFRRRDGVRVAWNC